MIRLKIQRREKKKKKKGKLMQRVVEWQGQAEGEV